MDGVIRARDVFQNFRLIWREFGFRCLLKCARACVVGPKTTFLDIAWEKHK